MEVSKSYAAFPPRTPNATAARVKPPRALPIAVDLAATPPMDALTPARPVERALAPIVPGAIAAVVFAPSPASVALNAVVSATIVTTAVPTICGIKSPRENWCQN